MVNHSVNKLGNILYLLQETPLWITVLRHAAKAYLCHTAHHLSSSHPYTYPHHSVKALSCLFPALQLPI